MLLKNIVVTSENCLITTKQKSLPYLTALPLRIVYCPSFALTILFSITVLQQSMMRESSWYSCQNRPPDVFTYMTPCFYWSQQLSISESMLGKPLQKNLLSQPMQFHTQIHVHSQTLINNYHYLILSEIYVLTSLQLDKEKRFICSLTMEVTSITP